MFKKVSRFSLLGSDATFFLVTLMSAIGTLARAKNISQFLALPFNTPGISPTSADGSQSLPVPNGYAVFTGGEAWKFDPQPKEGPAVFMNGSDVMSQTVQEALFKNTANDSGFTLAPNHAEELVNPSHVTLLYRGMWLIHLKPRSPLQQLTHSILGQNRVLESAPGDHMEATYFFAGTSECSAKIPRRKFKDAEFVVRSIGPKEDWMSRPVAIFYSMKKFQGKYAVAELFSNATWTSLTAQIVGFAPRSSIVVNSNWFIETPSTSFCLLGQDDVSYIFDWKAEKYGDPDKDKTFPIVTPGCPTRPYQSQPFPDPTWEGRDFCYAAHE